MQTPPEPLAPPARKYLALLLTSPTTTSPEQYAVPFIHALAACALDVSVELHFAGPSVRLLVEGCADQLYSTPSQEKTLGDYLEELKAEKVRLYACSMAVAQWIAPHEQLTTACQQAGATRFMVRALDPDWSTLVY